MCCKERWFYGKSLGPSVRENMQSLGSVSLKWQKVSQLNQNHGGLMQASNAPGTCMGAEFACRDAAVGGTWRDTQTQSSRAERSKLHRPETSRRRGSSSREGPDLRWGKMEQAAHLVLSRSTAEDSAQTEQRTGSLRGEGSASRGPKKNSAGFSGFGDLGVLSLFVCLFVGLIRTRGLRG